ncbi:hypothetical protein DFQ26_008603 [Actinomortierella ambigua]|nr:hypothetical protein DFQ26_008603 [Actinomortierella ambigua]
MAEPSTPAPAPAPAAISIVNGSPPTTKQPKASTPSPSASTTTAIGSAPGATSAAHATSTSTSASAAAAAVLTADDIKYKRKYRDLKKRIREIEELDTVDLPTPNHSLDHASSSSGSEEANEAPSRRGSAKKKGAQPAASANSNVMTLGRKPKGRPPGRKSAATGPSSRRRGTTQEKEQQSVAEKEERSQPHGQDEEEDQLDEEEYEAQATKDAPTHDGDASEGRDATQDNTMLIDQATSYSDAETSHETAVKEEEAMAVDSKHLRADVSAHEDPIEMNVDVSKPAMQQPQDKPHNDHDHHPMHEVRGSQGAASSAGSNPEFDQAQSHPRLATL